MKVKLLLTAITLSCLAIDVLAQVSISGKIVSADTNEPVVGISVSIKAFQDAPQMIKASFPSAISLMGNTY